jgi:hypothetical protein
MKFDKALDYMGPTFEKVMKSSKHNHKSKYAGGINNACMQILSLERTMVDSLIR